MSIEKEHSLQIAAYRKERRFKTVVDYLESMEDRDRGLTKALKCDYHLALANAYSEYGSFSLANDTYEIALSLSKNPDYVSCFFIQSLIRQGQIERAETIARDMLDDGRSNNTTVHKLKRSLAKICVLKGDYCKAVILYEDSLSSAGLYTGTLPQDLEHARNLQAFEPDNPMAGLYDFVNYLQNVSLNSEVRDKLDLLFLRERTPLENDPYKKASTYAMLSWHLLYYGRIKNSSSLIEAAFRFDPDNPYAHAAKVYRELRKNSPRTAREHFLASATQIGQIPSVFTTLSRSFQIAGDEEMAQAIAEIAQSELPSLCPSARKVIQTVLSSAPH